MTQQIPLQLLPEWSGTDIPGLSQQGEMQPPPLAAELYVAITTDASFKVGTCEHCVLFEQGRPARAWDADGDAELDFDRDRYFSLLKQFGIVMKERQAYVCP